jgi:hypothetical protein
MPFITMYQKLLIIFKVWSAAKKVTVPEPEGVVMMSFTDGPSR